MMRRVTTLGLGERLERVLAYAFFWVSGIVLLLFERNRNVRWHALQSVVTFGTLSLLLAATSILRGLLEWIPLIGWLISLGLGLLFSILSWTWLILWVWLMIMAWIRPDYRLPLINKWMRYFSL
jgi:uncharacterized membrane protein